jgi:hypothetical protein
VGNTFLGGEAAEVIGRAVPVSDPEFQNGIMRADVFISGYLERTRSV